MSTETVEVLLIEDNPDDANLIQELLSETVITQFNLQTADRLSSGLSRLADGGLDIVLLDLGLPDSQGLDTLDRVLAASPEVAVVVLTGLDDKTTGIEAVQRGAQDCLVKGEVDGPLLTRSLRYAVERKHTRVELQELKEFNEDIVQSMSEGIIIDDVDGCITFANRAAAAMLGYSREELAGKYIKEFIPSDQHEVVQAANERRRRGEADQYELVIQSREGICRSVLVSGSPRYKDGHYAGTLAVFADITKRKRAEEALVHERDLLHTLMDNIPDTIYFKDADSRFTRVNKAQAEMLGCATPEHALGKTDLDFYAPEFAQGTFDDERRIVETGQPVVGKVEQLKWPDGQARWGSATKIPIRDSLGQVTGIVGITRDITDLKRAEEALRDSEVRYRRLFEAAKDGILILDAETGQIVDVNPFLVNLLGYSHEKFLGKRIWEIGLFENIAASKTAFAELREQRYIRYEDLPLETAGGKQISVEFVSNVYEVDHRRVIQCNIRDITERKRAQEALRESEDRFRSTFEQAAVGIAHVSPNGRFLRLNQRFCEIAGYTHAELLERTFGDITFPDDLEADLADVERLLAGTLQTLAKEKRYVRKDGSVVWINLTSALLREPSGEPKYLITVIEDISKRKRLEEAEREQRALAEALADVAATLNSTLDLEGVLESVLANVGRVAPHDSANVMLIESDVARVVRQQGRADLEDEENLDWVIAETPTLSQMVETRKPLAIPDTQGSSLWIPTMRWVRSYAGAPICLDEEVSGFINLNGATPNMFTAEGARRLQAFADQAAVAIQNAQLFGQTEQRAAYLAALNDTSNRVSRWGLDLDGVLQAIVTVLVERVGVALARVWLVDEAEEELILRASAGLHTRLDGEHARLRIAAEHPGHVGQIARGRKPVLLNQIEEHDQFDREWVEENGLVGFAGYPLHKNSHLIAVLTIFSTQPLDKAMLDMLGSFANQAAIAIENARLYKELEEYSGILEQAVEERTAELRQTKERVEAILNHSPDPILLLKPDGAIEAANPVLLQVFGYHVDELYGQPPTNLVSPDSADVMRDALRSAIDKHEVVRLELIARRRDGTTFDAGVALAPIRVSNTLLGVVCNLRDISMLKEVARMRDAFVSNVSHELRTPITSMKLNHRLILMNPEKSVMYVERLGREIDRLNVLIEDLLRLSRLDQGRVMLDLKPVDFNALAAQYVNDRTPLAESKDLTLSFEAGAGLLSVQADEGLVGQVLSVLLTNALNYTPAGGQVTVSTRSGQFEGGQWMGFSVSDTGPGITPDDQPHLFERFYRGKAGHDSGAPGTGLGLAIAQEIVTRHYGRIEVESEGVPGKGATFIVWLPLKE